MTDPRRPVVEPVDTQRTDEVLGAWLQAHPYPIEPDTVETVCAALGELRGMIAAALADARLAGRAEGAEVDPL